MTVIEAMGTGIPVIASDVGGLSDMIITGHSGTLIRPDAAELADAIEQMLKDDNFRQDMGVNARMEVSRFSAGNMAGKYLNLYQEQIDRWVEFNRPGKKKKK